MGLTHLPARTTKFISAIPGRFLVITCPTDFSAPKFGHVSMSVLDYCRCLNDSKPKITGKMTPANLQIFKDSIVQVSYVWVIARMIQNLST
jgi:hypothetical protein